MEGVLSHIRGKKDVFPFSLFLFFILASSLKVIPIRFKTWSDGGRFSGLSAQMTMNTAFERVALVQSRSIASPLPPCPKKVSGIFLPA